MNYWKGAPDALPSVDIAMVSSMTFKDAWTSSLEVLEGCSACPTQTHLWSGAKVNWQGVDIEIQVVHTEWFSDPSKQIKYMAEQIRAKYMDGPLILVGDFNMPQDKMTRPSSTALLELVTGTGLKATCEHKGKNCLDPDVEMPLPPTEWISDLHLDWIFYRGLEFEKQTIDEVTCSDHMPVAATFRLPRLLSEYSVRIQANLKEEKLI
eukprot:TRINITY_DN112430_c0_g1_i1.p1 TRINITY_DN112430_c0_g1~~TRINITY_DN112430_c0_g1_i1.p1  ORF type:complete len:208 (+),score=36.32 TRINITY_DN112430_c0_g1_i1:1-624(+)